jgi:hypothetical protein
MGEADGKPFAIEHFGDFPGGKCSGGMPRKCEARFEIPASAFAAGAPVKKGK